MAKIQELLFDKNQQIDYKKLITENPWVVKKNNNCILSPDSDGLLCGLFLSHFLGWKVVGFYDGKILVLKDGISCYDENTCFLDIEVWREGIKSIGHHMLLYNRRYKHENWDRNFRNCIQPNLMRNYDGAKTFRLKYPLATIHLLLGIIAQKIKIEIPESAICPLLFTDGTFKVLFSYPENVMNWFNYLRVHEEANPLSAVFLNEKYSVFRLMSAMDDFFRMRDEISVSKERGDRLKISNTDGSTYNIEQENDVYFINEDAKQRIIKFIKILSDLTGWKYNENSWVFNNMKKYEFTKADFTANNWNVTNKNFDALMELNPLSWAMTSGQNIEFTIEKPDKLP